MKATQCLVFFFFALLCSACSQKAKLAKLYVPIRCIQKVSWTKPCNTISDHLVRCDGVMVTTACVSAQTPKGGGLERDKLPQN